MSDQPYKPPEIWRIELSRVEQVLGIKVGHLTARINKLEQIVAQLDALVKNNLPK